MADDTVVPDPLQAQLDAANQDIADLTASKESLEQDLIDANSALDLSNSRVTQLQSDNVALGAKVTDLAAQLATAKAMEATAQISPANVIDSTKVVFRGTVKQAMEHFRKQYCDENDSAIILKE